MKQFATSVFPNGEINHLRDGQLMLSTITIDVIHVIMFFGLVWFLYWAFSRKNEI